MRPDSIWTQPDVFTRAMGLVAQGISYHEVAKTLHEEFGTDFTADQVRSKLRRERQRIGGSNRSSILEVPPKDGRRETLVISDLHQPFEIPTIFDIVNDQFPGASNLIIAGDGLDCYSVSKFKKERDIAVTHEMKLHHAKLRGWSKRFERIDEIEGNHINRIEDYIQSQIDARLQFLVDAKLLHRFHSGFTIPHEGGENEVFKGIPNYYPHDSWWMMQGDAIIAHPKTFSGIPMRTVHFTDDFFNVRNIYHRALLIGHTHQAGTAISGQHLLVECGCTCKPMEYAESRGNVKYKRQANAVFLLVQYDGVTDFNESKLVYLEGVS